MATPNDIKRRRYIYIEAIYDAIYDNSEQENLEENYIQISALAIITAKLLRDFKEKGGGPKGMWDIFGKIVQDTIILDVLEHSE